MSHQKSSIIKQLGLIGYPLSHSFSKGYFSRKFQAEQIDGWAYENYPIPNIKDFSSLWKENPNLVGLNVTIPYKQQVIPYLDELDATAALIGAVNTIKKEDNRLIGYNTDAYGFNYALQKLLGDTPIQNALILGTGGASLAVRHVLEKRNISYQLVSRSPAKSPLTYATLSPQIIQSHLLIIHTTPLGTYPSIDTAPALDYKALTAHHFLLDLVYNPPITSFLHQGMKQGAHTLNGLLMLEQQAEEAWRVWRGSER